MYNPKRLLSRKTSVDDEEEEKKRRPCTQRHGDMAQPGGLTEILGCDAAKDALYLPKEALLLLFVSMIDQHRTLALKFVG